MSDLDEQFERTKSLCVQIQQLLAGANETDARAALAAMMAKLCLMNENPDRAFLESMDAALAVFRESSNSKYRNEDKAIS